MKKKNKLGLKQPENNYNFLYNSNNDNNNENDNKNMHTPTLFAQDFKNTHSHGLGKFKAMSREECNREYREREREREALN